MMAKSLASEAIVTEKGRAADRAQGFQTIHPSRDTLNARGWLENEWQLVQQRGAGRTTCSQTPLSVTTLVVITAYTKLRLLSRTNPGSVYWRKESKWKVSRKGAEKEDCVCYAKWNATAFDFVAWCDKISLTVPLNPQTAARRMFLTDRHSSQYISVCTGMKKSMSAHSHASSISASEPSYRHGKPSSEPTQRE